MSYVANRVDEAPAKPKSITLNAKMPMTNVGKIYKPPLRRDAAERAFTEALAGQPATVTVRDDPAKGLSARVTLIDRAKEKDVRAIMEQYTIPFEIA